MATTLYNTTQLWELEQKLEAEIDKIMELLSDPEISSDDVGRARYRLERMSGASTWLSMMQECVKTDEAVIDLKDSVTVTLWDFELI